MWPNPAGVTTRKSRSEDRLFRVPAQQALRTAPRAVPPRRVSAEQTGNLRPVGYSACPRPNTTCPRSSRSRATSSDSTRPTTAAAVRRASARRPSTSAPTSSRWASHREFYEPIPRRTNVVARVPGRNPRQAGARRARAPGRRARDRRGLERRPVRRRDPRRDAVGPRRRRHEGHGRHDPHLGGRPPAGGGAARARPHPRVLRRRGERRRRRIGARRPRPAGMVRGCDRGDQRSRRLLDRRRRSPRVSAAGGGEGAHLDPPRGARPRGARQQPARRQCGDPARGGGIGARPHAVAGPSHRHDPRAARTGSRR